MEDNFRARRMNSNTFLTYTKDKYSVKAHSINIPNYDKLTFLIYNRIQNMEITYKIMEYLKFQMTQEDIYLRQITRNLEMAIHENELLTLVDDIITLVNKSEHISHFQADFIWKQAHGFYKIGTSYRTFRTSKDSTSYYIDQTDDDNDYTDENEGYETT